MKQKRRLEAQAEHGAFMLRDHATDLTAACQTVVLFWHFGTCFRWAPKCWWSESLPRATRKDAGPATQGRGPSREFLQPHMGVFVEAVQYREPVANRPCGVVSARPWRPSASPCKRHRTGSSSGRHRCLHSRFQGMTGCAWKQEGVLSSPLTAG